MNILLETLRKYPIAVTLRRKCTENYTIPGTDTVIEKGKLLSWKILNNVMVLNVIRYSGAHSGNWAAYGS